MHKPIKEMTFKEFLLWSKEEGLFRGCTLKTATSGVVRSNDSTLSPQLLNVKLGDIPMTTLFTYSSVYQLLRFPGVGHKFCRELAKRVRKLRLPWVIDHNDRDPKFKVTYGETGGSKQLTIHYCGKVNLAELRETIAREFPGVDEKNINVFGGPTCVFTTGQNLEVPAT